MGFFSCVSSTKLQRTKCSVMPSHKYVFCSWWMLNEWFWAIMILLSCNFSNKGVGWPVLISICEVERAPSCLWLDSHYHFKWLLIFPDQNYLLVKNMGWKHLESCAIPLQDGFNKICWVFGEGSLRLCPRKSCLGLDSVKMITMVMKQSQAIIYSSFVSENFNFFLSWNTNQVCHYTTQQFIHIKISHATPPYIMAQSPSTSSLCLWYKI